MTSPHRHLQLSTVPCVQVGGHDVALAPPDALMLAWLALEGPTPRERIATLLWPASTAEAARNALRQRLFRLRKQLGADLVSGQTVLVLAENLTHDLGDSAKLLGELHWPESPELDTWLDRRRAAHQGQQRQQLEAQVEALEAAGDTAAALPLVQALVDAEPLSEAAHRRLMRLHYLRGDRAAALLAFDRLEALLKHEVGAAPSSETLALLATLEQAAPLEQRTPVRGAMPAAMLRPPQLVGRGAELQAMASALAAGQVVVLVGEAGMGKSRLFQALAADAALRPHTLMHVSGRPGDVLVPYATLARALRQLLDQHPTAADPALRRELAPLLPEWAPAANATPAAARTPLARPVLALLQQAQHALWALALDDLHFADDATLELLQALLTAPRDSAPALRWCLGLRPPAPGSRQQALLDALATAGPHTRLALQPLTEPQLAELVDSLALPGVHGASTAALLHQRTGGNPLFALETLKLAWAEGALQGAAALSAAGLPRPASLAQLISQQLARLSAPALQLARVAAVAGVDFCIALAETLLGKTALDLADAWADLEAQHVLRGDAFSHDLIHDAVLQGLPVPIARHLHGQAAAWLEKSGGEPARVAAHWEAAGQRSRALPALRSAAEAARRALREGDRIDLLLHAADIAEAEGRHDEAFDLVNSAVDGHMNTIRHADGLPLLDRQQALARSDWQRARVTANRAWYMAVLGDYGQSLQLGEEALRQALPLGDEGLVASVRQRLGTAMGMTGHFDRALAHLRAAEPWMEARASAEDRVEFQGNLAAVLDNLGQAEAAQEHHVRAIADSALHSDAAQRATLLANYAISRLDAGDAQGAVEQATQAQRIVQNFDHDGGSAGFIAVLLAQGERGLGHYRQALHWCDRAEAILAERIPSRLPVAQLHRAHVWLDLAQHARALQMLDSQALATARALQPRYAVRWLVLLARAKRRLGPGHETDAQALLAEAAALSPANGWPEVALIVRTEQALGHEGDAADTALREVADDAMQRHLHSAALAAWLHLAWRSADPGLALHAARQALALQAHTEALHADRALRWLAPARALQASAPADAAALVQAGQAWLRTTSAAHVAPEFADSFLHQHPLNRLLLAGVTQDPKRVTPP
jgi:DNA-binding SARP family transcriptional activator